MSTRATYKIQHNFGSLMTYIHYDGYPTGAAQYFFEAQVAARVHNKTLPQVWMFANERAELTESHEIHGDTDFRYDLVQRGGEWRVTVHKRDGYDVDTYSVFFRGTLLEFLSEYHDYRPLRQFHPSPASNEYATVDLEGMGVS